MQTGIFAIRAGFEPEYRPIVPAPFLDFQKGRYFFTLSPTTKKYFFRYKGASFFSEMGLALERSGFETTMAENGLMAVLLDDRPLCQIADTGGVRYRDLDIGDAARNEALDRVIASAKTVSEYMNLLESANI